MFKPASTTLVVEVDFNPVQILLNTITQVKARELTYLGYKQIFILNPRKTSNKHNRLDLKE